MRCKMSRLVSVIEILAVRGGNANALRCWREWEPIGGGGEIS